MAEKDMKTALVVAGLVMTKNQFPPKDGKEPRYSIDLAVSGLKNMLSVNLPFDQWSQIELLSIFKSPVRYNLFKGNVYWQLAQ